MPKFQLMLYTETLYANVVIEAKDEDAARAKAADLGDEELMKLNWEISDDALAGYNLRKNYAVDEDNVELFKGGRPADVTAEGEED